MNLFVNYQAKLTFILFQVMKRGMPKIQISKTWFYFTSISTVTRVGDVVQGKEPTDRV